MLGNLMDLFTTRLMDVFERKTKAEREEDSRRRSDGHYGSWTFLSPHNVRVPAAVEFPLRRHRQPRCLALPVLEETQSVGVPGLKVGRRQEGRDHGFQLVIRQPGERSAASQLGGGTKRGV